MGIRSPKLYLMGIRSPKLYLMGIRSLRAQVLRRGLHRSFSLVCSDLRGCRLVRGLRPLRLLLPLGNPAHGRL